MATRQRTGLNVFDQSINRMVEIYEQGHRVVVSFSAGKDSGICLEICRLAAAETGRLPVEVIMRDEEIMFPGTYEYAERIANDPEISFNWIYACQPIINVYDRAHPYWWVFDPLLPPEKWVRQPPAMARKIDYLNIDSMTIPDVFPPDPGKTLFSVVGLRVSESKARLYGLFSAGGYITKPNRWGVRGARPIYDWSDGDVWKAIKDNKWDYNEAYDVMNRLGIPRDKLRIAPPTMNAHGAASLKMAQRAWPIWFERVCARLEGVRQGANFGKRAVMPFRRFDETWEQCFQRLCIDDAPQWIRERSIEVRRRMLSAHAHHSTMPFSEVNPCVHCINRLGSWKNLTLAFFMGDPFSQKCSGLLDFVEPEAFRPGAGKWGGPPTF